MPLSVSLVLLVSYVIFEVYKWRTKMRNFGLPIPEGHTLLLGHLGVLHRHMQKVGTKHNISE